MYNDVNFIRYNKCKILENNIFSFWRVSSNLENKHIIQKKCIFEKSHSNMITEIINEKSIFRSGQKSRMVGIVSWDEKYTKNVPFANLIFYNRSFFGYKISEFPIRELSHKWNLLLQYEFLRANEWYYFLLCINKKIYIPLDIKRYIFHFWNTLHDF